jgi:hypothetical protein
MVLVNEAIVAYQRGIINGLAQETFNPDEINKRFEVCEKLIPKYKDYFTSKQLEIMRLIYADAKRYNQDGHVAFGLSEANIKLLLVKFSHLEEELMEVLGTGARPVEVIEEDLKMLEKLTIENRLLGVKK